ncbi:MAG: His/Gly/Thr/Pro-type tRNA ligase C-terminal domain-containing protein, partial [Planctomycetota bacterium]
PAAEELRDKIVAAGFRANLMSEGPLRKRVRESEMDKIPYMAVIGGREAENGEVNVRIHGVKEQKTLAQDAFLQVLEAKRSSKALGYEFE